MAEEASREEDRDLDLPPGTYRVTEEGDIEPRSPGHIIAEEFDWENEAPDLIRQWLERGERESIWDLGGMYILVGITILSASLLAWVGVLGGQAVAGFLGAAIGYLLSRAQPDRQ